MARNCGCAGSSCGCSIVSGSAGLHITGVGSAKDPYRVTIDQSAITGSLNVTDTATIDLTINGSGTIQDPYILTATALYPVTTGNWNSALTGITLGAAGTDVGTFRQVGKHVVAERVITLGTSGFAVGDTSIPLPVALTVARNTRGIIGWATYFDVSAGATYYGPILANGDTTTIKLRTGAQPAVALGAAAPFAWAAGDIVTIELDYMVG